LTKVREIVVGTNIKLGAQNCSYAQNGAYTGEISADMLKDIGLEYVILGHSERRSLFGETNEIVNKKAKLAISKGLKVIICVGENLLERKENRTFEVIKSQLINCIDGLDFNYLVIAYEPVWAIGTGNTATPEQVEEVHAFIRKVISENLSTCGQEEFSIENDIRILYGGSVNSTAIEGLMKCENVDGGLVGGASLKIKDFADIVKLA
jgi:triosephosphate isomerase